MSATTTVRRIRSPLFYSLQRLGVEALCLALGFVLVVWSLTPIYNMWKIALDSHAGIFGGSIWPEAPTLESFPRRGDPGFLVPRTLLAPVRQQLHRRVVSDSA